MEIDQGDLRHHAEISEHFRAREEEEVISIAIRQWQEEGRLQGLAEGKADSLVQILELRFGPVDQAVQRQLRHQSAEVLSAAINRALTAPTLAEALDGLKRH